MTKLQRDAEKQLIMLLDNKLYSMVSGKDHKLMIDKFNLRIL